MAQRAADAAFAMLMLLAAPAAAQPVQQSASAWTDRWPIPEEKLPLARKGISLPVIEYLAPGGRLQVRRGIVASVEVAPNTLVGVGLFEAHPKKDALPPERPLEVKSKPSRKAAIGISFSF